MIPLDDVAAVFLGAALGAEPLARLVNLDDDVRLADLRRVSPHLRGFDQADRELLLPGARGCGLEGGSDAAQPGIRGL